MRLASISLPESTSAEEKRDGRLVVVAADGSTGRLLSDERCLTMRRALDNWDAVLPILSQAAQGNLGTELDLSKVSIKAPLPRATDFVDGSGYISHIVRVRKARGAEPPEDVRTNPLMYRGIPTFLDPTADIHVERFEDGPDCEGELAVILGDVPAGVSPEDAVKCIRLITQINDISLRNRIKQELPKQFGFLQSKPPSSMGPFALTLDELGPDWNGGRPRLTMYLERNSEKLGELDTAELHFSLGELIAHAAETHPLGAGTVLGTGTIANQDESRGVACIAERVALDTIAGRSITPYFAEGEVVSIETKRSHSSLFGQIVNRFVR